MASFPYYPKKLACPSPRNSRRVENDLIEDIRNDTDILFLYSKVDFDFLDESGWSPLLIAVNEGYVELVKELLERGADCNFKCNPLGQTALTCAIQKGYTDIALCLINSGADVNECDKESKTPLGEAVLKCDLKVVEMLIEKKAELDDLTSSNNTPLAHAAKMGNLRLVRRLLDGGADINGKAEIDIFAYNFPLARASNEGHLEVVQLLIREGANLDLVNWSGDTALMCCIAKGHIEIVKELVSAGANVNKCGKHMKKTPLGEASYTGKEEIVKILINGGATPDLCDYLGFTPLSYSAQKGHTEIFRYLLNSGADINKIDNDKRTALTYVTSELFPKFAKIIIDNHIKMDSDVTNFCLRNSIKVENHEFVKHFVEYGANVNKTDKRGKTPLFYAVQTKNLQMTQFLLDNAAHFSVHSAFLKPVTDGDLKIIQLLLESGANVNTLYKNGNTPLLEAIDSGNFQTVQFLIESGADVNLFSKNGTFPLVRAVEKEKLEIVKKLIECGARVNMTDDIGNSPLTKSLESEKREGITKVLIENGANNLANKSFLLLPYLDKRKTEMVKVFVDHGANSNVIGLCGFTPLTKSAQMDDLHMVKCLVGKNANVNQFDEYNNTALSLAASNLNFAMFEFLINVGADTKRVKDKLDAVAMDNDDFSIYLKSLQSRKMKGSNSVKAAETIRLTTSNQEVWCPTK